MAGQSVRSAQGLRRGGMPRREAPMSRLTRPRSLVLLVVALCASPLLAQPAEGPADQDYVRSRNFPLPFDLAPGDKPQMQQVKLYVKKPEPGAQWEVHATASPAQMQYNARTQTEVGSFDVRLDRDGIHLFAVMVVY